MHEVGFLGGVLLGWAAATALGVATMLALSAYGGRRPRGDFRRVPISAVVSRASRARRARRGGGPPGTAPAPPA